MNHTTKLVLCFGIVLLVTAAVFVATASASSEVETAKLFYPQVFALQGPPITYTLTINVNPSSGGSVTKNPNLPVYISGTVVSLTAVPAAGWKFDSWSGELSGTSLSSSITMTGNRSVAANFSQLPCFTLTTSASPSGGGTVTANPTPNCNGGTQYYSGTVVSLTANVNSGYTFSSWSGAATGSANPTTVTMNGNKSVTANLTAVVTCYTLTTAANPSNAGLVVVNTASNCSGGRYTSGTTVSLNAVAASGYTFSSWTGCDAPSGANCTMTMNANKSVIANFAAIPATQTATATSTSVATSTTSPYATITPLIGGVVVATATVVPAPSSGLPPTGGSPLNWIAVGLVLVLIVIGARYMRQSSV